MKQVKKKVKDLTKEEAQKICDSHYCYNCPLFGTTFNSVCIKNVIIMYKESLEKEVKVEVKE